LNADTCGDIAERLRLAIAALELPHCGIGQGGLVTISAGAASFAPSADCAPYDLFAAADCALYAAKQCGRNRVCLASASPVGGAGQAAVFPPAPRVGEGI
jgi:PleD family two-component response regulator